MIPIMLAAVAFYSCGGAAEVEERAVARAYDEQLLWSDLRQVIPFDLAPADSAALAQQYIHNWMRKQAVLHHAEANLSDPDKDFETQLRDYRNSLVIFTYEQALVQQKLDTVVGQQEMEEYHVRNGANFELHEPILRVRWSKVREDDKRVLKRLREHFISGDPDRMHEMEMWLAARGLGFADRSGGWLKLSTLLMELSFNEEAPEFTGAPRRIVHQEGNTAWFIDVLELRSAGEVAPLELVSADIRAIIINQRKLQLLERMREDLYREALEERHIEIF